MSKFIINYSLLACIVFLTGCSKSSEPSSNSKIATSPSTSNQSSETKKEEKSFNNEQMNFNAKVFQLENIRKSSDRSTRSGDAELQAASEELKSIRDSFVNKKIENWVCIFFNPIGPKDISKNFSSFERDGQRVSEIICSSKQDVKFNSDISQTIGEEITLSVYEKDAIKIGKIYNNDRIVFSGTVQDFSSRGPGKYYMRVNVDSISASEAK